jgi:hypothetical protein
MFGPPSRSEPYASSVIWAREFLDKCRRDPARKPSEKQTRCTAARIHRLGAGVQIDLTKAEAPFHVFRWVAWSPRKGGLAAQRQRADIVLHLRRTFHRRQEGWFLEVECAAALGVWMAAIAEARSHGRMPPRVDEVAPELYEAAVREARTKPRRSPCASQGAAEVPQVVVEAAVLRAFIKLLQQAVPEASAAAAAQ